MRVRRFLIWPACFAIGVGLLLFSAIGLTPVPKGSNQTQFAKVLLDRHGELLAAKIAEDQQWRFPSLDTLPDKYVTAVTHFEDRQFYRHPGVNPVALVRAFTSNFKANRVVSGGSTITMQLARILRGDPPRTYWNKAQEIFLALKLEWIYSKDEILSLYASQAPFGGNTVGVNAASWRYFRRSLYGEAASSVPLSWAEAALLAVLPNSPGLIHPGRGREQLLAKRNRLLSSLLESQLISAADYKLSVLEPLPEKPNPVPQIAIHLLESLLRKHPEQSLFESSIDGVTQQRLLRTARQHGARLSNQGIHNLSLVVIDNRDYSIAAYLGNVVSAQNPRQYSPAVDIAVRPRSTGSVLKPFLYGFMLQAGDILPETLVADVPSSYAGFTPENYDRQFRGAVAAKQALAQSLNIPAVRMLKQFGVSRFRHQLEQLGMSTLFRSADDYGLSLILGGAEGTLWELTSIYARLVGAAKDGRFMPKVSALPEVLPQSSSEGGMMPMSQGAAWLTLDALKNVARPEHERFWREYAGSQPIAWKTGTSYGLRDAWAIGSHAMYTVGVWSGNASGEGVAGLSGLQSSAPLLFDTFEILGGARWFDAPEHALKRLEVCAADGFLAANDCPIKSVLAPVESHFQLSSPHYVSVKTDLSGAYRVHGGCERVSQMRSEPYFTLPPLQAFYWQKWHSHFPVPPDWKESCLVNLANFTEDVPMEIIYPLEGSKIFIPRELSGEQGKVVFKATHRRPKSALYWHIDNRFLLQTELFHELELAVDEGWHLLTLVDDLGFRVERWFRVLSANQ